MQWPPEDRNVAIAQDGEVIGYAGEVSIEVIVLRCAGAQGSGQVEVLLGVWIPGADVRGAPVPAEGGDAAFLEIPTGGAIVDEGPLAWIDVVKA